jgi:hypothetical protein
MAGTMSLTPIGISFGFVAVLFIAAGAVSVRWISGGWGPATGGSSPPTPLAWGAAVRIAWLPAAAEALLLTLLAALWFGSLGHGGWGLVFLLLGAIAGGGDRWLRHRALATPAGPELRLFAASLLKYLLAGGLCAWCLS